MSKNYLYLTIPLKIQGNVSRHDRMKVGGADRDRTGDLRRAKPALSPLSYSPNSYPTGCLSDLRSPICDQHVFAMVGLSGFEPLTSRLSGVRSNQLSYRPLCLQFSQSELFNIKHTFAPTSLNNKKSGANRNLSSLHSFERR